MDLKYSVAKQLNTLARADTTTQSNRRKVDKLFSKGSISLEKRKKWKDCIDNDYNSKVEQVDEFFISISKRTASTAATNESTTDFVTIVPQTMQIYEKSREVVLIPVDPHLTVTKSVSGGFISDFFRPSSKAIPEAVKKTYKCIYCTKFSTNQKAAFVKHEQVHRNNNHPKLADVKTKTLTSLFNDSANATDQHNERLQEVIEVLGEMIAKNKDHAPKKDEK